MNKRGWLHMRAIAIGALATGVCAIALFSRSAVASGATDPNLQPFPDDSGTIRTISTTGTFDTTNPFFTAMGTNGRSCASCHQVAQGMTITPEFAQDLFQATSGLDPLFLPVDGSNSPNADVSTVAARQAAYSMLLNRGTIRIGIGMPANADFQLVAVDDPYHFASAAQLSLFRRPLPTTNIAFASSVMWDGRMTANGRTIAQGLANQIADAVSGHEQGTIPPTSAQVSKIIDFERALFTAQFANTTPAAGVLSASGGLGGPGNLSSQKFYIGINDSLGHNPTGAKFNPNVMRLYDAWTTSTPPPTPTTAQLAQASVARGQAIFNTRTFTIKNVAGFNDVAGKSIVGTCSTCHDTPNIGSHSTAQLMHTGVSDATRRTPDLPLYTFVCTATGQTVQTTDPGAALISGKCADIGKFKVPSLRGLDARSPYFHDGSGTGFQSVLDFYNARFAINFTPQEQTDLIAFLSTL